MLQRTIVVSILLALGFAVLPGCGDAAKDTGGPRVKSGAVDNAGPAARGGAPKSDAGGGAKASKVE